MIKVFSETTETQSDTCGCTCLRSVWGLQGGSSPLLVCHAWPFVKSDWTGFSQKRTVKLRGVWRWPDWCRIYADGTASVWVKWMWGSYAQDCGVLVGLLRLTSVPLCLLSSFHVSLCLCLSALPEMKSRRSGIHLWIFTSLDQTQLYH